MVKKKNKFKKALIIIGVIIGIYLLIGLIVSPMITRTINPVYKILFYPIILFTINQQYDDDLQDPSMCTSNDDASCNIKFCEDSDGEWTYIKGLGSMSGYNIEGGGICKCNINSVWRTGFGCNMMTGFG